MTRKDTMNRKSDSPLVQCIKYHLKSASICPLNRVISRINREAVHPCREITWSKDLVHWGHLRAIYLIWQTRGERHWHEPGVKAWLYWPVTSMLRFKATVCLVGEVTLLCPCEKSFSSCVRVFFLLPCVGHIAGLPARHSQPRHLFAFVIRLQMCLMIEQFLRTAASAPSGVQQAHLCKLSSLLFFKAYGVVPPLWWRRGGGGLHARRCLIDMYRGGKKIESSGLQKGFCSPAWPPSLIAQATRN